VKKSVEILAKNKQLYLRKVVKSDAAFLFNLLNQKNWLEYIGDRKIKTLKDAESYIKTGPTQSYKTHGFGLYLVVRLGDDCPVGLCGFLQRAYLKSPDLGFAISQDFYQQGYGYSAAVLALNMMKQMSDAKLIYATVKQTNVASMKLLQKLGFVPTTYLFENIINEQSSDFLLYKYAV
jgi:RimJ/RimL family protein N-acetyltransferase